MSSSDDDVPISRNPRLSGLIKSSGRKLSINSNRRSAKSMGSGSSGTLRATGLSRRSDAIAEAVKRSPKKSDSSSHDRPASALHYFHGRTNLNKIASEGPRKRKNITARNEDAPTSDDSDVPIVSKRKLNDGKPQAVKHETAAERIPTEQASREPANGQKRHATFPRSPAANEKLQRGVKTHKQGEVKSTGPSDQRLGRALATTKKSTIKPAKQPGTSKAKAEAEAEQDLDETYKWWENQAEGDGSVKWTTLEHNGVMFPPPYEPLPKNVKFVYDGVSVGLSEEAEEIATFFGAMLDSQVNMSNPKFVENFFDDFKAAIKESGGAVNRNGARIMVTTIEKCDFKPIYDHFQRKKAEKAALTNAEKKAIKAEKETIETSYAHCIWDGRKEKVGNFRVEPPGLFRGRGDHPKTGRVKKRVRPNQITINIGKGAKVPDPPTGTKWKKIQHDNTVSWLAMWTENINGAFKYVMLAAKSSIKGQSDFKKFEKARELDKNIARIRRDYTSDLLADLTADRQRATAMWLIDKLGLRAGNEKGEDEADTVGCCSLKLEHVTLQPGPRNKPEGGKVIFDFLGKDSIRFHNEYGVGEHDTIPIQVYKNLKIFKKEPKTDGDQIFDRLSTTSLNEHLKTCMPGLSAKVFRTYNASKKMSELLRDSSRFKGTVNEKFKAYNDANRDVAIFCNHKRTVGAGHSTQMGKLEDKVKGMKYQQWRLKQMMLVSDLMVAKHKRSKNSNYFDLPEELDDGWIRTHQETLVELERQKITKKFGRDNDKLIAANEKEMKPSELESRLEAAADLEKKFKLETRTNKIRPEPSNITLEKLESKINGIDGQLGNALLQAEDKESNKEVALNTSRINYIDPRLTVVFCKRYGVPIEKPFAKTLREKFAWAIGSVDADWEF